MSKMEQEDPVQPLRLSKGSNGSAPSPQSTRPSGIPRPLSEISPHERRRNSPSWNQATQKPATMTDSSPFQSSPLENVTSPRLFWQNRSFNSDERTGSPTRRSSIERLQKASRVKNSNLRALEQKEEYDPAKIPDIQRPLSKIQGNNFGGGGVNGFQGRPLFGHGKSQSTTSIPILNPPSLTKAATMPISTSPIRPTTPSKESGSPLKSSLSSNRFKSSFDHETGTWSDISGDERRLPEGKSLHRHAKSVTFDQAPPQVNEYEMATPAPSSIGSNSREGSYDSTDEDDDDDHYMIHNMDQDDSFDASLEDTDKTPVVGPDDWRHNNHEDPFDRSPMPDDLPPVPRPHHQRTDSSASNGESRPLPPLPGMDGTSRSLPSPPSASKLEAQGLGNSRMPLEERLKLMMLSDDGKSAAEQQRERRMRRAGARGSQTPDHESKSPVVQPQEDEEELDTVGELSGLDEYQLPPRISRESILRRVNGNKALDRESDYNFSSPAVGMSPDRQVYDPDVPIPSTEDNVSVLGDEPVSVLDDESDYDSDQGSVIIKRDPADQESDLYSIPDTYERSEVTDDYSSDYDSDSRFDEESQYSEGTDLHVTKSSQTQEDDQVPTPRATTPVDEPTPLVQEAEKALPEAPKENRLSRGLEASLLPKPEEKEAVPGPEKASQPEPLPQPEKRPLTPELQLRRSLTKPEYDGTGWGEDEFEESDPGTPESVIHRPMPDSDDEEARASPAIPEQIATIKSASGSKLKTRPSATPADLATMREARRQVSREVPPIPDRHRNRLSVNMDNELAPPAEDDYMDRHPSFKKRSLTLDLDLGLSLDKDFDRVIEAQKRGYLMRQNTKVITASDKMTEDFRARSAGNSPTKVAQRPQSWTVEPWNSQPARKRSFKKKPSNLGASGPVPPLPGQESNAAAVATQSGNDEDVGAELSPGDENGERGRLFVKVMGVKDLDLPIPKNERTWFSLTLDNGVHCVTTAWLELARNAPIGQEFELVVPNDLEFQLTLNVKLEKPVEKPVAKALPSPTKLSKPKTSAFSRVFASPKKRKEMELRQRQAEEEERLAAQREAQARQMKSQPTAWDLLSPLAADDGSFARAYVCLKDHESKCFGRPYLVDVAAFNEWAMEDAGFASSVKSKRGNMGPGSVVRRAPYKIGKLELQLLFVPRPKGATDEDMPKSMNSCIREMKAAEERLARCWEGHLSQQGGDCPYWRRRYFKLVGTKLTAYHEATRQPRATINLANAKRLIDDRRTLMEKETLGKGGKRRRSAFAEDEEGYMFVEEGFRIRFNNGELIDFYADTAEDKEGWMKVLGEVVGKEVVPGDGVDDVVGSVVAGGGGGSKMKGKWCELVMKREEQLKRKESASQGGGGRRVHSRTKSALT